VCLAVIADGRRTPENLELISLLLMGLMQRLNQLRVSRQIKKIVNELEVIREVRNIDNEYADLVKSATEDEEKKNIRAKVEYYKSIYGSPEMATPKTVNDTEFFNAPRAMKFFETIKFSYKNYSNFEGRASRSEFWYWVEFVALTTTALALVVSFVGIDRIYSSNFLAIFVLSSIIPTLARVVRRLHDTDKPGIYALFWFTPIVGYFLLLFWLCTKSDFGSNRFGPSARVIHEAPTRYQAPQRSLKPVSDGQRTKSRSSNSFIKKLLRKLFS
jgi:uncharacterized membrane protein YhaH (DUF805 family)